MRRAQPNRLVHAALSLTLLFGTPAAARPIARAAPPDPAATQRQLQEIERNRASVAAAQREAAARVATAQAEQQRLARARVAAAAKLQDVDQQVQDAAAKLEDLAGRRRLAERRLAARAADMVPLLPLIERLSLFPTETMLAIPESPEDTMRGVLVLKGLARQLEAEAAGLNAERDEVTVLSQQITAAMPALRSAQEVQTALAASLDRQIGDARQTERDATDASDDAARQEAADAARADSLRAAIGQIESARRDAEATAREDAARAERQKRLTDADAARTRQQALARPAGPGLTSPQADIGAPVAGRVVHSFGEAGDGGPANGISYAAAPAARVLAPCAGRAVFAGPFRSFGLLLILNCGGGYHFVLAGLERLDVAVGRPVQAGEPIGVMPNWDPQSSGAHPVLYVELRHDGQPVNPAPWLKAKG